MWSTPSSTTRRSTASAASRSRGGPKTPGPASCIAPNPMRPTGRPPNMDVVDVVIRPRCATVTRATRRASILGAAPPPSEARRAELAEFLKHRRALVGPESVGFEANGRRRTPGLRREEVAQLAGVGLSWYTWLEQERDIRPSAQVLDALARTLRLDAGERAHLFHLARVELPLPAGDYPREAPPPPPGGLPTLLGWLSAGAHPRREQWRDTARSTLARFRAEHARRIGDPDFAALIEALEGVSPDFRAWWPRHEVLTEQLGTKTIDHPDLGTLRLHHLQSMPTSHPDLRLTQFAPADDTTRATLQALL